MKCITVSDMKKNASNLDVSESIMVTQNGNPVLVISSYADYIRDQKMMKSLIRSVKYPLSK